MPRPWMAVVLAGVLWAALPARASAAERLQAVASFSILADMVATVGGDRVAVSALVGPGADAHVFQPAPADAAKVARAKVMFVNGLGYEGWLARLIEASGSTAAVVTLSDGITPLARADQAQTTAAAEQGHDTDPHAWQNVANAIVYSTAIANGLCAADPDGCSIYQANAQVYGAELTALDAEIQRAIAALPADRRTIITSHDAFGYFASRYGITFLAPEGVSTEAEASAADVARLIVQLRTAKASALFVENITDKRLIEQIARDTGIKIGGTLYSDALSDANGPAATYIGMMRHNLSELTKALAGK
jgi:zinc/manganese transport system substrate-binding protein